jgi:O-methyltransferase involved in polyketide biosynthesis
MASRLVTLSEYTRAPFGMNPTMSAPTCRAAAFAHSLTYVTNRVSVDLSGPAKTMLSTLYLKALDADFERPVLGDRFAKEAIDKLDFDWRELEITPKWAPLFTVRTAQYDIWVREFIAAHKECTVVHLGCGLDCRVFRIDPGPDVRWYDVDFPQVIALREQIYPTRPNYQLIATPATEPNWLDQIPADRPTVLIAEGISMYLTEEEGIALLQRFIDRFGTGELQIDFFNWLAIKSQKTQSLVRTSGSTLYWAVNSPQDILDRVPGIGLLNAVTFFDASTFSRASATFRIAKHVLRLVPPVRKSLQYHRYAFGPVS